MQKKLYLLVGILVLLANTSSAQVNLVAGTYNDVLLESFSSTSQAVCDTNPDFSMIVDSSLIPYVDGMTVMMVITGITQPQPNSIFTDYGPVSNGDIIPFDTAAAYEFFFPAGGSLQWELRAMGIPTTVGDTVPCFYEIQATLGFCNNTITLQPAFGSSTCEVMPNASLEDGRSLGWEVYPNPSYGLLRLQHKDGISQWEAAELFDLQGRSIRKWRSGEEISTEGVESGTYFLKAYDQERPFVFRIIVE